MKKQRTEPGVREIWYSDIMALGFTEDLQHDEVYLAQYGYPWSIITLDLTNKIYLNWEKETQHAEMIRLNNRKDCSIVSRLPIRDIDHLNEIVRFFTDGVDKLDQQIA